VLRVLGSEGTRLRELPALTGTSTESVRWALGILTRGDLAAEEPDPAASRGKVARLTPRGLDAQHLYHELTGTIERRWHDRFTSEVTGALRASLEPLATGPAAGPVRRDRAVPGQLARLGPPSGHPAALPDGAAPRRLSRRQLTPLAHS
jgi:hypothetical protein